MLSSDLGLSRAKEKYYQKNGDVKLTVTPQDTAYIMAMRTLVSDTMIAPMKTLADKDANYFVITSADGLKTVHRTIDMYLDDATMYVGCDDHEESFPCISDAADDNNTQQHSVQLHDFSLEAARKVAKAVLQWTRLKYIVGQGPELSKYGWQILTWKNVDGCLEPATSDETPCTVTVKDHFGHSHKIKRVELDEPLEGLGFLRTALEGKTHQFRKAISSARSLAKKLRHGSALKPRESWLVLKSRIYPVIAYPLALISFTAEQYKRTSVILEYAILPTLCISRKMKKAVVYAPLELGGIGLSSTQCLQDQKSIQHLVCQLDWGREPAKGIRIVLSQPELQTGFLAPLLSYPTLSAPHIEPGWLSHIPHRN